MADVAARTTGTGPLVIRGREERSRSADAPVGMRVERMTSDDVEGRVGTSLVRNEVDGMEWDVPSAPSIPLFVPLRIESALQR